MNGEIQLVSDGDGLAVIGSSSDVECFLISQGLDRLPSKDLRLQRLGKISSKGAVAAQTTSAIATGSGRWVQITEKSAQHIKQFGFMTSKDTGLSLGVVQAGSGKIKGIVEFATGPGSLLGNPAILAGAAGIMAQVAIQQQMDEIVEYLQEINEKVDDILRAQKDAVLADMIGVNLIIEDALTVRDQVGRVSEVPWSKVQGTSVTIARTQAYALRQLDALAEELEKREDADEIAKAAKDAEVKVREWLAVLARTPGRDFIARARPSARRLAGRTRPTPHRTNHCAPEASRTHRAEYRAFADGNGQKRPKGELEGTVQSIQVAGRRTVEQPSRH